MHLSSQLAKHIREVYFGGNWTTSNFKEQLADVTLTQALTKVYSFNSIATLLFHTNYFVVVASRFLKNGKLEGSDKLSFDHPPLNSQSDWENMLKKSLEDAEEFASLVEKLPEDKFGEIFSQEKYGSYYRNIAGIIEHLHYHLGQIVLIRKIVQSK